MCRCRGLHLRLCLHARVHRHEWLQVRGRVKLRAREQMVRVQVVEGGLAPAQRGRSCRLVVELERGGDQRRRQRCSCSFPRLHCHEAGLHVLAIVMDPDPWQRVMPDRQATVVETDCLNGVEGTTNRTVVIAVMITRRLLRAWAACDALTIMLRALNGRTVTVRGIHYDHQRGERSQLQRHPHLTSCFLHLYTCPAAPVTESPLARSVQLLVEAIHQWLIISSWT